MVRVTGSVTGQISSRIPAKVLCFFKLIVTYMSLLKKIYVDSALKKADILDSKYPDKKIEPPLPVYV